ncbi:hypothetical protein BST22_12760 [Mycolicibacterium chubuense]|nr:hypothetical protein BST22_12760 [Mycolicibacterium chubuense]
MAVAVVAGTSVLAQPVDTAERAAPVRVTAAVEYTASSTPLRPRPAVAPNSAADVSTPFADAIDDAFIDLTVVVRTGITPVLNRLGFVGKQIYIGLNLIESLTASAVFNGTDILRGEGVVANLRDVATDVGYSALFVAIDEVSTVMSPEAIAINRPPLDRPVRWEDADPPFKGRPLSVPDRDREEVAADETENAATDERPSRDGVFTAWKAKKAERAEKAAEARKARQERRDAVKVEKGDRADTSAPDGQGPDTSGGDE